jgi:hypothetical protein
MSTKHQPASRRKPPVVVARPTAALHYWGDRGEHHSFDDVRWEAEIADRADDLRAARAERRSCDD